MTIINLAEEKEKRKPHTAGQALCLACGYKWEAVAPLGDIWLECSECHLYKGRYINPVQREGLHYHCDCGCDLFYATPEGIYCPMCGEWQDISYE